MFLLKTTHWMLITLLGLCCGCFAETVLFDFEERPVADYLTVPEDAVGMRVDVVEKYASSGEHALRFITPKWKQGMPSWPYFDLAVSENDWTDYDRLVFDVVNPSRELIRFKFFIVGPNMPSNQGIKNGETLNPLGHTQVVVDLKKRFKGARVKPNAVEKLHFFLTRPSSDVELYLDRIVLLKEGDALPEPRSGFRREVTQLLRELPDIEHIQKNLKQIESQIAADSQSPLITASLEEAKKQIQTRLEQALATIGTDIPAINIMSDIRNTLLFSEKALALGDIHQACRRVLETKELADTPWADTIIGIASSMTKVHPKDVMPAIEPTDSIKVRLAKNEKESFQVVLMPVGQDLKAVKVQVGKFTSETGDAFPADKITSHVVGFVKTALPNQKLITHNPYVGWWPDPIIPFIESADIAQGDAQPFWIKVDAPKDIASGTYTGRLLVLAEGVEKPYEITLGIDVFDFVLPDESPLPLAVSYSHHRAEQIAKTAEPNYSPEMWAEKWKTLKFVWADFLAEYYIDYDNLYYRGPDWPDYEIVDHLRAKNKLTCFNLGNVGHGPAKLEQVDQYVKTLLKDLRPAYDKAKERGLLDRAYVYGFDERPQSYFPILNEVARQLKEALPGVPMMTTAGYFADYWGSAEHVEWWCPIVPNWDSDKAEKERAQGQKAWWYICISSGPPFPNALIDEDAIDLRLLMGAMTAKYQPDGFLYYAINRYIGHVDKPLVNHTQYFNPDGPFTDWNPRSFKESNGDGFWVYPGPGGEPVGNIRLENFRDGLEDYAYYTLLERAVAEMEAKETLSNVQQRWLENAKKTLVVPEGLVRNLKDYTKKPDIVNQYRLNLAGYISKIPR